MVLINSLTNCCSGQAAGFTQWTGENIWISCHPCHWECSKLWNHHWAMPTGSIMLCILEPYFFSLYLFSFWKSGTINSLPNELFEVSICSVTVDVKTSTTGLLWCWRKTFLKNVIRTSGIMTKLESVSQTELTNMCAACLCVQIQLSCDSKNKCRFWCKLRRWGAKGFEWAVHHSCSSNCSLC